jgi:phosphonate transport system ATP-binding protein
MLTPSENNLQLKGITVTYPNGVCAVDSVEAVIAEGSFCVLLGSSGAGKSTLLRCLNGLVVPTNGQVIEAGGRSIHSSPIVLRTHRQRTGMIFQQHHLIGRLSAFKNVLIGRLSFHGGLRAMWPLPRRDRSLALEALERVGLLDRALTRADELSGGQQQRVGIARALVQQPSIVLADEPVASLDPETSLKVLSDLHRICREDKITAVVSLHQVELARQFADRIIGVADGRIVADGPPSALTASAIDHIYKVSSQNIPIAAE